MITGYATIRNNTITVDGNEIYSAPGPLSDFLVRAYEHHVTDYPKFYKMDNLSRTGFIAAELLIRKHSLSKFSSEEIALVLANKHSSLDTDGRYVRSARTAPSPALFVYTLPNIVAGEISIRHKMKGENAFFVSDAFDPMLMSRYVDSLFAGGRTRVCLTGWVDVMEDHHDVFLYLIEKDAMRSSSEEADQVAALYESTYGTIDR